MIDAFYADSIPFHLSTAEFLELVREQLRAGRRRRRQHDRRDRRRRLAARALDLPTYRSAFPTVLLHPVSTPGETPERLRNVMLVATDGAAPEPRRSCCARWNEIRARAPDGARPRRSRSATAIDRPLRLDGVPVLTDDYAPTDSLLLLD